ncbi:Eukaryotic translation initiation factor 2 alpha kinase 4 [Cladochytrium tenue]|nr:Eukaryotic translation initiation factor 2 alpha kinase 4 [Cladochytrium tenue]
MTALARGRLPGVTAAALLAVAALVAVTTVRRAARLRRRVRELRRLNPHLTVHPSLLSRLSPWVLFSPLPRRWLAAFAGGWELRDPVGPFIDAAERNAAAAAADAAAAAVPPSPPGKSFAVVTPDDIWVFVAEPNLSHELLVARQRDFPRPTHYYSPLVIGLNVLSADGDDWRRQRRVVAPLFSDRNNALVLDETARLAHDMFLHWEKAAGAAPTFAVNITADMARFALKIVCSAGFGFDVGWEDVVPPGRSISIEAAMLGSARSRTLLYNLSPWLAPLLRGPIARARALVAEYDAHVAAAIAAARAATDDKPAAAGRGAGATGSLLAALVRAASDDVTSTLSEQELYNNILLIFFAGYFTTAATLSNAVLLLASDPAAQDRLRDEAAAAATVADDGNTTWPHFASLKDLQRLPFALAVMNETLRLHPIVTNTAAWTAAAPVQQLGSLVLPAESHVYVAIRSLHRDPASWGPDADRFRPTRWLADDSSDPDPADAAASVASPAPRGAFLPFSEGPRACLGRRFAQVEYVALLSLLALRYRWELPPTADPAHVLEGDVRVFLVSQSQQSVVFRRR